MSLLIKYKIAMAVALIYFAIVLYAIVEYNSVGPEPMSGFGLLILTLPWSFIFLLIFESTGLAANGNDIVLQATVLFAGMINTLLFYFFGYFLTRGFHHLTNTKKDHS